MTHRTLSPAARAGGCVRLTDVPEPPPSAPADAPKPAPGPGDKLLKPKDTPHE